MRITWSLPASWLIGSRPMPARSNARSASTPSAAVSSVVIGGVASLASSPACSSRNSSPRERRSAPSARSARIACRSAGSSSQMIRACSPHAARSASAAQVGGRSDSPEAYTPVSSATAASRAARSSSGRALPNSSATRSATTASARCAASPGSPPASLSTRRSLVGSNSTRHSIDAPSSLPQIQSLTRQDRLRNPENRLSDAPPALSSGVRL